MLKLLLAFLVLFTSLSGSFAQKDSLQAVDLLEHGKTLYYDGDYSMAQKVFEKALKLSEIAFGPESSQVMQVLYRKGKNEKYLRTHPEAIQTLQRGLAIAKKTSGEKSEEAGDFLIELGHVYSQMYQPRQASFYYQESLSIFEALYGAESSDVGNIYMNFGINLIKMANYHDADRYFQQAFEVFKKSSSPTSADFYRIYSNRGYLYRKMGDYDRALEFAHKALEIKLMHYEAHHPSVAKYHRNIAKNHQEMGEFAKALPFMQQAVEVCEKSLGKSHPQTAGSYAELAHVYADLGASKKALRMYQKALKIQQKTLNPTHPYLVAGYFNIGRVYEDMGDYNQALAYYQTALEQFQTGEYIPDHLIAQTQGKIADVLFEQGNINEALIKIGLGMERIVPAYEFDEINLYQNPSLDQVQSEVSLLGLLQAKTIFLQGKSLRDNNQNDLKEAFNTSELAIQLIEKMRRGYQSEEAKQFLNTKTAPIYEQAVEQAFELYQWTTNPDYLLKAFEISEKSKASILWQSLNEGYALEASGIPQQKLDAIDVLHNQIANLEEQLFETGGEQKAKEKLTSQLFDLKLEYEALIQGLEKHNPRYFQLKYTSPEVDLETLMDKLPDHKTVLINYFCTQNYVYQFILTKVGLKGFQTPITIDLEKSVLALRTNEMQASAYKEDTGNQYIAYLNQLHELLITPIALDLQEVKNLVIIPHDILQLLPFEMLAPATAENDFRRLPYLLKKYTIHYDWSATLWANAPTKDPTNSLAFLGFAPGFDKQEIAAIPNSFRKNLLPLTYSKPEVESANHYFQGKIFTDETASESRFLEFAPSSNIIHLATHAFADDRFPLHSSLVFSTTNDSLEDGFLHAYEIYNQHLVADLAVISACNTGFGQLAKGEGVMSLGRAFRHAGCKSVVMSLWLANDQSNHSIIQLFYKFLASGLPKNEALRAAKLEFIQTADPLTAHPYFWANLVAVGDMGPLRNQPQHWVWGLGLGLLSIGFLTLVWIKKGAPFLRD